MKRHSGAAKRFKKTASGQYKHRSANRSHNLSKKPTKRKRGLRPNRVLKAPDGRLIARILLDL